MATEIVFFPQYCCITCCDVEMDTNRDAVVGCKIDSVGIKKCRVSDMKSCDGCQKKSCGAPGASARKYCWNPSDAFLKHHHLEHPQKNPTREPVVKTANPDAVSFCEHPGCRVLAIDGTPFCWTDTPITPRELKKLCVCGQEIPLSSKHSSCADCLRCQESSLAKRTADTRNVPCHFPNKVFSGGSAPRGVVRIKSPDFSMTVGGRGTVGTFGAQIP